MSDSIKVKAISFTAEYKEEYAFLKKQGNASRLVCELVRQYRLAGGGDIKTIIKNNNTNGNEKHYDNYVLDSAKDLLT